MAIANSESLAGSVHGREQPDVASIGKVRNREEVYMMSDGL